MHTTVMVRDATTVRRSSEQSPGKPGNQEEHTFVLDLLSEQVTVRELIRSRVYQEVQEYNTLQPEHFRGLVEPSEAERTLNGVRLRKKRSINWEAQFKQAIDAFLHNGFLLLVDGEQVTELDEVIQVQMGTTVTFLKLVPLVGG